MPTPMKRRPFLASLLLGASAWLWPSLALSTRLGQIVPPFTLNDSNGRPVSLSDFQGRIVVLEWINPTCPFVNKHYQGNVQAMQAEFIRRGVVWLSIYTMRDDHPHYHTPPQLGRWLAAQKARPTAALIDEYGQLARALGVRVAPSVYIIDTRGVLAYAGGIDNIASTRVSDIQYATNFVRQALGELLTGQAVSIPASQAYGCAIHFPPSSS